MNLTEIIYRNAETRKTHVALITSTDRLNWVEFAARLSATVKYLETSGLTPSMRVGVSTTDQVHHLFICLALIRMGITQVALPVSDPHPVRQETAVFLELDAIIASPNIEPLSGLPTIAFGAVNWEGYEANQNLTPLAFKDDFPLLLLKSSGTTGAPKFAELSHSGLDKRFLRYREYFETNVDDIFWPASSVDFVVAKQRTLFSLFSGAAVALFNDLAINSNLVVTLDGIGVTIVCGTPSHAAKFCDLAQRDGELLPKVRVFEVRSATVTEPLRKQFKAKVSPNLYVIYATNEAETICLARPDTLGQIPHSVGTATQDIKVEIVDDTRQPVSAERVGLVRVKGAGVVSAYWKNPEATASSLPNGWFYPGDMARWEAGELIFLGRSDDMMIFDGINIYPAEIESVLVEHPLVKEAAAFPIKHQLYQDVPAVAIVAIPGTTKQRLMTDLRKSLGVKAPQRIFLLDALPRNSMGKFSKAALLQHLKREAAAITPQGRS